MPSRPVVSLYCPLHGSLVKVTYTLGINEVEVAMGLVSRVISYIGVPKILQSDNGREFVNEIMRESVWPGEVVIINGRRRHRQSQGLKSSSLAADTSNES